MVYGEPFARGDCECEYEDHFENVPGVHSYGGVPATYVATTDWGDFKLCEDCKNKHLAGYAKEFRRL